MRQLFERDSKRDKGGTPPQETVPALMHNTGQQYADWTDDDWQELYEERAGILEFDSGLNREVAEAQAADELRAWRTKLGYH